MVPEAMVIPLGKQAGLAVDLAGASPRRILRGFPHPSGANGHRLRHYITQRDQLQQSVRKWFG